MTNDIEDSRYSRGFLDNLSLLDTSAMLRDIMADYNKVLLISRLVEIIRKTIPVDMRGHDRFEIESQVDSTLDNIADAINDVVYVFDDGFKDVLFECIDSAKEYLTKTLDDLESRGFFN